MEYKRDQIFQCVIRFGGEFFMGIICICYSILWELSFFVTVFYDFILICYSIL